MNHECKNEFENEIIKKENLNIDKLITYVSDVARHSLLSTRSLFL